MKICNVCLKEITEETSYVTRCFEDGKDDVFICEDCYDHEEINNYVENGEITSSLMNKACLNYFRLENGRGYENLRPEIGAYYFRYRNVLPKIYYDCEEIIAAARFLEETWWLPVLQDYYNKSNYRGHRGEGDGFDALLWGSAGRVLLTLQDKPPNGKGKGKFGGAWITLIFDQESKIARGGLQALAATKNEALDLLKAASDEMPLMKVDSRVTLAGL